MDVERSGEIEDFVRQTMDAVRGSEHGIAHDFKHVDRVRRWALAIAAGERFTDRACLQAAALLHDVGLAHVAERREHARVGAEIAARFLRRQRSFAAPEIERIVDGVRHHNALGDLEPLATIVRDADMLDMLGAVGVMRAFTSKHAWPEYDPRNVKGETWQIAPREVDRRLAQGEPWRTIVDQINFQASCGQNVRTATARRLAAPLVTYMRGFLIQLEREVATQNAAR
jgi:putative nucleotidyltransferase with HDIG domain